MDAFAAIHGRRSIRRYTDRKISEAAIETMLRAAMSAPSANNLQPWRFIVIDDRTLLDAIPGFHPYSKMLREAPLAILVCGDASVVSHYGYLPLDCSAATQNLLLAAHALGLGAVWLGLYPRDERMDGMRKLFHLPDAIVPLNLISIGHPAETKQPSDRYDTTKIRLNKW